MKRNDCPDLQPALGDTPSWLDAGGGLCRLSKRRSAVSALRSKHISNDLFRGLCLYVGAAALTFGATHQAAAQLPGDAFDLSGTWSHNPSGLGAADIATRSYEWELINRFRSCTRLPGTIGGPGDLLDLRPRNIAPIIRESRFGDTVIGVSLNYDAFYTHNQVHFASSIVRPQVCLIQNCGSSEHSFAGTGELRVFLDPGERPTFSLVMDEVGSPSLPHPTGVFLSHIPSSLSELVTDAFGRRRTRMFSDPSGQSIEVIQRAGAGSEPTSADPNARFSDLCQYRYTDVSSTPTFLGGGLVIQGITPRTRLWRLGDGVAQQGRLAGTVRVHTPDTVPDEARVTLFLQDGTARAQAPSESDTDYRNYLITVSEPIAQTETGPDGSFAFNQLPIFRPVTTPSGRRVRGGAARYALVVTDGNVTVDPVVFGTDSLPLEQGLRTNLGVPNESVTLTLRVLDELQAKRRLIASLSARGPKHYAPIEQRVASYLDSFSGSPAALEGLRRGILAERIVDQAAAAAKPLIDLATAVLVGRLIDVVSAWIKVDSEAVSRSKLFEAKLQRNGGLLTPSQVRRYKLQGTQDWERYKEIRWSRSMRAVHAQLLGVIGSSIKIFKPVLVHGLALLGANKGKAESVASSVELIATSLLDYLASETLRGGLKGAAVKAAQTVATEAIASLLFKSVIESATLPVLNGIRDPNFIPSFTLLTEASLALSEDSMKRWANDDSAALSEAREDVAALANLLADTESRVTAQTRTLNAVAATSDFAFSNTETLSATKGALESLQKDSTARSVARKLGRVAKVGTGIGRLLRVVRIVSEGAGVVLPLYHALFNFPALADRGVHEAFDLDRERDTEPPLTGTRANWQDDEVTRATAAFDDAEGSLDALRDAYDNSDFSAVIAQFPDVLAKMEAAGSRYQPLLATAVAAAHDEYPSNTLRWVPVSQDMIAEYGEFLQAQAELAEQGQTFFGLTLSGIYLGLGDPELVAAQAAFEATLDQAIAAVGGMYTNFSKIGFSGPDPRAVRVELVRATPETLTADDTTLVLNLRVSNLSTTPVANVGLALQAFADEAGTVTLPRGETPVVGTLAARDATDGSGPDERTLRVDLRRVGSLGDAKVYLRIALTEADGEPSSFVPLTANFFAGQAAGAGDQDFDGLADSLETRIGSDPTVADGDLDSDGDGLSNEAELELGTDPGVADSDGDGLSDGEEMQGTQRAWVTEPLNPDTDGDGVLDGADGAPLDPSTSSEQAGPAEPSITLTPSTLALRYDLRSVTPNWNATPESVQETVDRTLGFVQVGFNGTTETTLKWRAWSSHPGLLVVRSEEALQGPVLHVALREGVPSTGLGLIDTQVFVEDLSGAVPDRAVLQVRIQAPPSPDAGDLRDVSDSGGGASDSDASEDDDTADTQPEAETPVGTAAANATPTEPQRNQNAASAGMDTGTANDAETPPSPSTCASAATQPSNWILLGLLAGLLIQQRRRARHLRS